MRIVLAISGATGAIMVSVPGRSTKSRGGTQIILSNAAKKNN
jgi:3-polyprenyl-4-hydroxybenzoate decarboxylase